MIHNDMNHKPQHSSLLFSSSLLFPSLLFSVFVSISSCILYCTLAILEI